MYWGSRDYVRELLRKNSDMKEKIKLWSGKWECCYLYNSFHAQSLGNSLATEIPTLLSLLPTSLWIPGGTQNQLETLACELEKLTGYIFDGTILLNWADMFSGFSRGEPVLVSEIIASLNYATDIVTISQVVLGSPEHVWHARKIDPRYIIDFKNSGGVEMVKALSRGVAIEDIISI